LEQAASSHRVDELSTVRHEEWIIEVQHTVGAAQGLERGRKIVRTAYGHFCELHAHVRARAVAPWSGIALVGCGGCDSLAILLSVGTSSFNSCTRFATISSTLITTPVMLPPGCPRL